MNSSFSKPLIPEQSQNFTVIIFLPGHCPSFTLITSHLIYFAASYLFSVPLISLFQSIKLQLSVRSFWSIVLVMSPLSSKTTFYRGKNLHLLACSYMTLCDLVPCPWWGSQTPTGARQVHKWAKCLWGRASKQCSNI